MATKKQQSAEVPEVEKGNEAPQSEVEKSSKKAKSSYTVISSFRDASNFDKVWNEGDVVSAFDKDRLDYLLDKKLVELK